MVDTNKGLQSRATETAKISGDLRVPKFNYNVEIYNGKSLLGVVTVRAESYEQASNVAVKDINVKIKRAWG